MRTVIESRKEIKEIREVIEDLKRKIAELEGKAEGIEWTLTDKKRTEVPK